MLRVCSAYAPDAPARLENADDSNPEGPEDLLNEDDDNSDAARALSFDGNARGNARPSE